MTTRPYIVQFKRAPSSPLFSSHLLRSQSTAHQGPAKPPYTFFNMAARLLLLLHPRPLLPPHALGLSLGASLFAAFHLTQQQPMRLDSSPFSRDSYRENQRTPVLRNENLNPAAVRQISSGSIIGASYFLVSIWGGPMKGGGD